MTIFINPGSGPVAEATEENARTALGLFVADLREQGCTVTGVTEGMRDCGDGRWGAVIVVDGRDMDVELPGCDPEVTRRGEPWVSPRLYIDGSSWLWQYARSCEVHR